MGNIGEVEGILTNLIDSKRMKHSIGVSRSAAALAKHYGANSEKAALAGLIHDCAKCLSYEDMIKKSEYYKLRLDDITCSSGALIHGPLGAAIAKDVFNIMDPEILEAVAYHTTGKIGMTIFQKIICLADYIEPGRSFNGVEVIRKYAYTDINKALLKAFELSIINVINRGWLLHPRTIEARNSLLSEIEGSHK